MTSIDLINLIASISSLVLAVGAIIFSYKSSRESEDNFQKTKDVLAEVDKRAAVIEATVNNSQEHLLTTLTNILNETAIPKKANINEQITSQFFQGLLSDPEKASKLVSSLAPLIQLAEIKSKQE